MRLHASKALSLLAFLAGGLFVSSAARADLLSLDFGGAEQTPGTRTPGSVASRSSDPQSDGVRFRRNRLVCAFWAVGRGAATAGMSSTSSDAPTGPPPGALLNASWAASCLLVSYLLSEREVLRAPPDLDSLFHPPRC